MEDVDEWLAHDFQGRLLQHGVECGDELNSAQRVTSASNLRDLLCQENDIRMLILLPVDFAIYANELVNKAMTEAGLEQTRVLEPAVQGVDFPIDPDARREGLFSWIIGRQVMWQQIDRRIDE